MTTPLRRMTTTLAVALFLGATGAQAAQLADPAATPNVPDAKVLLQFYPSALASTPNGMVEDQAVWLAKVQGLMVGAPPLLQQSLLMSRTKGEFSANVALLQQMQEGLLKQAGRDVKASVAPGRVGAKALGDASNLVYKPLEPCRIMDTRSATAGSGVQGPIAGNSLKNVPGFITAGSNWGIYGGNASGDCGLANPPGSAIHAVAIVITILAPNFDAYLGVSDVNNLTTVLSNVALNYTRNQGLSTMYIVPQISTNFIYFALPTGLSAQLIFDVVGYYVLSDATALQCTQQASSPVSIAAAGSGKTRVITRRVAWLPVSSMTTASATTQVLTPVRMQPAVTWSSRPKAACRCSTGRPLSSGKIVPAPAISCTSCRTRSMGTTGRTFPSSGPTTMRLPPPAPPSRMTAARAMPSFHAASSIHSCTMSPSSRRMTSARPSWARLYFI